jgi:hypothetical protein
MATGPSSTATASKRGNDGEPAQHGEEEPAEQVAFNAFGLAGEQGLGLTF